ncbi:MAG: hypothetical protein Q9226_002546 [Calogaya cf. arnoldii]
MYNLLPNGLHYEWTIKALKANKHVLLEKPSVSNASEARLLFRNPLLQGNGGTLIVLDAVHIRFHPVWQKFLNLIDPPNIEEAFSQSWVPPGLFAKDDVRFQYTLSGGSLMDLGSYNNQPLRQAFASEPIECISATARLMPEGFYQDIDKAFTASWRFPNGGIGTIYADSQYSGRDLLWLTYYLPPVRSPKFGVRHREVVVPCAEVEGMEMAARKMVVFRSRCGIGFDVIESYELREIATGEVKKTWTETQYLKCYSGEGIGGNAS